MTREAPFHHQLDTLARDNRRRRLIARTGMDFSSNDYLGLAGSDRVRQIMSDAIARGIPAGSGGSRLLRGNHCEHERLEALAADHYGSEAALFFSTGYAANSALFSTLPQSGDLVLYDALIHASAHEGMRLGRAECRSFAHNDMDALQTACRNWRNDGNNGAIWIAVESLYSMDGDRAPIADIDGLVREFGAWLVVDEAHATGIFGTGGQGLSSEISGAPYLVTLRTCGKALGVEGGLLCLPAVLRDFMVNRARGLIFSTAPSPLIAATVSGVIESLAADPGPRNRLAALIAHAETRLGGYCPPSASGSQIFPVIVGENGRAMAVAEALQRQGFDVRGIRPPTVPVGTARLRISLSLNVDSAAVDALADALAMQNVEPLEERAA